MARGKRLSIDEKIEKKKEEVFALKEKYDAAVAELSQLQKKRKEMQGKEILKAFESSDKSLEEILAFMSAGNGEEEEDE